MKSNDEEEDFPTANPHNPIQSEEPIPNRQQQLCIQQILQHTPRPSSPPLQASQEEVPAEP